MIQELTNRAMDIYKSTGVAPTQLDVTAAEMQEIISLMPEDPPPSPPVKRRASSEGFISGLFTFGSMSGHEVEYDHHAPEYLEARERWQQRQAKRTPENIQLITPCGTISFKVKT